MTDSSGKNIIDTQYSPEKNLKVLRLLHEITGISAGPAKTIDEKLDEIVNIIPPAFGNPDEIWARIIHGHEEFKTANYRSTGRIIKADIIVREKKTGFLEIGCTATSPAMNKVMETGQEKLLITNVAERVGAVIEHYRAKQALLESEDKFYKAFRAIPESVAIATLDGGVFLEINDSFVKLNGLTRDEVIGHTAKELNFWVNFQDRVRMKQLIEKNGHFSNVEYLFRRKSGEQRTVLFSGELISFDGQPCMLTIGNDITEKRHDQEFLESISTASPFAIYILQDEILKYTNRQFQTITGYNQQEIPGMDLLNIVASADKDILRASTVNTLMGGKPYPCEYRILQKNSTVKWVMQTVAPIHYDNREAILGSLMDITERKYLERKVTEYEELNKMKGDILATVSHELRTPLAAIKGYTTMMLDHQSRISSDELMENLIAINNSADTLIMMINNLLDTSRLDSGMFDLKKSLCSISAVIKSVVKTASIRIVTHRITARLPASLPKINIDNKRIRQVLENLIANAQRNSPAGTEIRIAAVKKSRNIEVGITYQGPAIPENELKSVFDRMYNIENREYSGIESMGLGLHICQRLIEAHGGHILAENEPGKGSTLRFILPLGTAPKSAGIKGLDKSTG